MKYLTMFFLLISASCFAYRVDYYHIPPESHAALCLIYDNVSHKHNLYIVPSYYGTEKDELDYITSYYTPVSITYASMLLPKYGFLNKNYGFTAN